MTTKSGHINGIYYQKWILTCDSSTENSSPHVLVQALCVCIYCKLLLIYGEGNGNPLQYSCLENPRDGGAWWAAVCGVARGRTRLKRLSSSSSSIINFSLSHGCYFLSYCSQLYLKAALLGLQKVKAIQNTIFKFVNTLTDLKYRLQIISLWTIQLHCLNYISTYITEISC